MNAPQTEQPLIFTKYGNLPLADLQHHVAWEDTPEYTKFVEMYSLNGEIVKESVHVRSKVGLPIGAEAGGIG